MQPLATQSDKDGSSQKLVSPRLVRRVGVCDWRATDAIPDGAADRDSGGLLTTTSCVLTVSPPRSGKCCRPDH
jgi:hypothetical protein